MYRIISTCQRGRVVSLHETATEAMATTCNLLDAGIETFTITDATGGRLTEVQLAMLVMRERTRPERERPDA